MCAWFFSRATLSLGHRNEFGDLWGLVFLFVIVTVPKSVNWVRS